MTTITMLHYLYMQVLSKRVHLGKPGIIRDENKECQSPLTERCICTWSIHYAEVSPFDPRYEAMTSYPAVAL